ncbi:hypothetical protein [Flavobacterium faecale]|uniref:hypothetical protein n=1 Tax=Flavobacterium faecale TaxID=1355330 RepID=UPI003AAF0193
MILLKSSYPNYVGKSDFDKTDVALYKTFDAQKPERPENSSFSILIKTTTQLLFS